MGCTFTTFALRKAKIVYNFGISECKRVKRKNPKTVYNFGLSECNRVKGNNPKLYTILAFLGATGLKETICSKKN